MPRTLEIKREGVRIIEVTRDEEWTVGNPHPVIARASQLKRFGDGTVE